MTKLQDKAASCGAWIAIVLPVIFLSALGILILLSAGANRADPYIIVRKQAVWMCVAFAAGVFTAFIDFKVLKRIALPFAAVTVIALLLVLVPQIGKEVNGSRRWLEAAGVAIQPSDMAKFAMIILLSSYMQNTQRKMKSVFRGLVAPMGIVAAFCAPIMMEPDFGTTLLCGLVGVAMIFMAGANVKHMLLLGSPFAAVFALVVYLNPNRLKRILSFLDVEGTKSDGSYQLYQAILGFGCGGVSGAGIGQGRQQLSFLPEAHTDFVFAIIGEELGLICTLAVAAAFLWLFFALLYNLKKAPNLFEFMLALGAGLMIVLQALFNMCVVTGLMPTKGISLPFISYGGSNLVAMFAFTGLLVNCARRWGKPTQIKAAKL